MASRKTTAVTIALFLVLSSSMAIMINNDSDNVSGSGINYDEDGWIKISTPEQLSKIGGEDYPLDGKYVLTEDIDFTGKDINGGFDMKIRVVTYGASFGIFLKYSEGGGDVTSSNNIYVSINGNEGTIAAGGVGYNVPESPDDYLNITVGGVANNAPGDPGSTVFAVSVELYMDDSVVDSDPIKSNGNMDPLCTEDPFTGTFHGNGKKITGLETAVYSDSDSYSALFAHAEGATFDGIGLIGGSSVAVSSTNTYAGGLVGSGSSTMTDCYNTGDVTVTLLSSSSSSSFILRSYVGGLVGYGTTITMMDCYNTGDVTASSSSPSSSPSSSYVGGLVGSGVTVKMTNCYNTGSISVSSSPSSTTSYSYAGGLVGSGTTITMTNCYNEGSVSVTATSSSTTPLRAGGLVGTGTTITMTNCYNEGSVIITTTSSITNSYAGGLVGFGNTTITMTDCYNIGDVTVTSSLSYNANLDAGGLVGYGSTITMTDCYNTGDVTVTSSKSYAGGLVGYGNTMITMTDCYNTGDVTATSSSPSSSLSEAYSYAGGLVGFGNTSSTITMTNCYNTGDVTVTSSSTSSSSPSSEAYSYSYAGGLVGSGTTITMTNCYNEGSVSVTATSSSSSDTYSYAGGLVGSGSTIKTTNCYNAGNVTATSSSTTNSYAGGLVGSGETMTMINCYSIGEISVSGSNVYKGGIIGSGSGTCYITNCYFSNYLDEGLKLFHYVFDAIVDGLPGSGRTSELSGSRYLNDLAKKTTYYAGETEYRPGPGNPPIFFPGWDFDNTWCIDGDANNGFPFLRSTVIMGQPSDVTAEKVDGNVFSIRLGATGGTVQWQKLTGGQWNDISGATGLTHTTKATDAFGDQFRCVVTLGNETFTSDSASLLKGSIDDPGTDDPGTDDPGTDGNGGDDGGDNTMLFVGIAAVAAIAVIGVVYFVFIRKP